MARSACTDVGALDMVEAPKLGPDGRLEAHQCSRADIAQVLRPRIEEILELMDGRLSKASAAGQTACRDGSFSRVARRQLPCLQELAEDVFRAPVRLARPANIKGLGETYSSPAFAAAAGLLRWELMGGPDPSRGAATGAPWITACGLVKRVSGWLQENF